MIGAASGDQQAAAEALAEMVDHLVAHSADHDDLDHLVAALDIVQALCWENVSLRDIPEPFVMNPMRKALAASVVERLALEVYSSPPHNQHQQVPAWCAAVPPSPADVWLVAPEWADGAALNPIFYRRNIIALANFLSFV